MIVHVGVGSCGCQCDVGRETDSLSKATGDTQLEWPQSRGAHGPYLMEG